jgi:hypothetical protein
MPRSLKTISWRRGIVIDLPKKKKHRPGNIQAEAEPPDDQALRLLNHYRELASMSRSRSSQW